MKSGTIQILDDQVNYLLLKMTCFCFGGCGRKNTKVNIKELQFADLLFLFSVLTTENF